jgi:hypothetical protein
MTLFNEILAYHQQQVNFYFEIFKGEWKFDGMVAQIIQELTK